MQKTTSPALQALSGRAGVLWRDAHVRQQRVEALYLAHQAAQDPRVAPAVRNEAQQLADAFTADVRAGMQASGWEHQGLARHLILTVIQLLRGRTGAAYPPRELQISSALLAAVGKGTRSDSVIRTWVQELVHNRQPIPDDYHLELDYFTGYEEGLAEGIARLLVIQDAGMTPRIGVYSHYAYAYREISQELGMEPRALFLRLWDAPMGRVRRAFPEVVDAILQEHGHPNRSAEQLTRLRSTADELFDPGKINIPVAVEALRSAWREALR